MAFKNLMFIFLLTICFGPMIALKCYQCDDIDNGTPCDTATPTDCPGNETSCRQYTRYSSGPSEHYKTCEPSCTGSTLKISGGVTQRSQCCQTDGCNNFDWNNPNEPLKCYQCTGIDECNSQTTPTACPDGKENCLTTIVKKNGRTTDLKKSCHESCVTSSTVSNSVTSKTTCCYDKDGCNDSTAPGSSGQGLGVNTLVLKITCVFALVMMLK